MSLRRPVEIPAEAGATLRSLLPQWVGTADRLASSVDPESPLLPGERELIQDAAPKRKAEFVAGRESAHEAMRALGIQPAPVLASDNRVPIWPQGLSGSITHSNGYCAAAVAHSSDAAGVGIDVEAIERFDEKLWSRICTPAELAWLSEQDVALRRGYAALIFSAKEAAYKCQYPFQKRWLWFNHLQISIHAYGFEASLSDPAGDPHGLFPMRGRYAYCGPLVLSAALLPAGKSW